MGSLMLKELANELKGVLTIIYNRSLSESKLPIFKSQFLKKVKSVMQVIIDP